MVKTNYRIMQLLKKPDLVGRLVSLVELSKYYIQYILIGSIKSQVLAYFLAKFSLPVGKKTTATWKLLVDGT